MLNNINIITEPTKDYELLDSGGEEKLERYGVRVLRRPDPQAIWNKSLPETEWDSADAVFIRKGTTGKWEVKKDLLPDWDITFGEATVGLKLLPSKHLGLFPEQLPQWQWISEKIKKETNGKREISVLNLFGYTGGASLMCARAGAEVVHVDASKFVVDAAVKNLEKSNLKDRKVRFIVDDVRKFVEREIKRKHTYDVILLDPPIYGKGSGGEVWKIEEDLPQLLSRLKLLLSPSPVAVVLNGYASIYSPITYAQLLEEMLPRNSGTISAGEMGIRESHSKRILPCGVFARFEK